MNTGLYYKNNIQKNGDDFSVTGKLAEYIGNKEWHKGYINAVNGTPSDSDTSFVWAQLSAINEEIGSTVYSKILNYVNEISNIDTCNIHALNSMTDLLGVEYKIPELNRLYPLEIEELLNVFSINRNFLLNSEKVLTAQTRNTILAQISSTAPDYIGLDSKYSIIISNISQTLDGTYKLTSGVHNTDTAVYTQTNNSYVTNTISKLTVPTNANTLSELAIPSVWALKDNGASLIATAPTLEGRWYPVLTITDSVATSLSLPSINGVTFYNTFATFNAIDITLTNTNYVYVSQDEKYDLYFLNPVLHTIPDGSMTLYDSSWFIKHMASDIYSPLYASESEEILSNYICYSENDNNPTILLLSSYELGDDVSIATNRFTPLMMNDTTLLELSGVAVSADIKAVDASAFVPRQVTIGGLTALEVLNGVYTLTNGSYNLSIASLRVVGASLISWTASSGNILNLAVSLDGSQNVVYTWTISDPYQTYILTNIVTSNSPVIDITEVVNPPLTNWGLGELEITYLLGKGITTSAMPSLTYFRATATTPLYNESIYVTNSAYRAYVVSVFNEVISTMCNLQYREFEAGEAPLSSDAFGGVIWRNIISELTPESLYTKLDTTSETIIAQKIAHNIPSNFNEISIVDNISIGLDLLDKYNESEQIILNLEIARRAENRILKYNISKYAKYRENKVKEYFKFVNEFARNTESLANLSAYVDYSIDSKYFIYDIENVNFIKYTLAGEPYLAADIIDIMANKLADIAINVAYAREQLKVHTKKTSIKGTYNLLEYMIKSYIIENIYKQPYFDIYNERLNIELIEYLDSTEYFNISATSGDAALNPRYWASTSDDADIQTFYASLGLDILSGGTYDDFMNVVYSAGATNATPSSIPTSSDEYDILRSYIGTSAGYRPFYNIKNANHPSYQILSYITNFIEYTKDQYPIQNLFDYSTELYSDDILTNINTYIDNNGNFIDIWKDGRYDYSGYLSRFESALNVDGITSNLIDRDGPFIIEAYTALLADSAVFIDSILTQTNIYYDHLELNDNDRVFISNAISKNASRYAALKAKNVYKYCEDIYGNAYTLYKNTNIANELGELWIRLKNHPISIPAFAVYNGELIADSCILNSFDKSMHSKILEAFETGTNSGQFFDMELDQSGTILGLVYIPVRLDGDTINAQDISRANVLFGQVKRVYNRTQNTYIYQFNKDSKHAFEACTVKPNEALEDGTTNRWQYCGTFRHNGGLNVVFIKYNSVNGLNLYNTVTDTYESKPEIYMETYHSLYGNTSINKTTPVRLTYKLSYDNNNLPIIKFASCTNMISFALECEYINASQYIINYCENDPTLTYINAGTLDLASMNMEKLSFDIFDKLITTIDFTLSADNLDFDGIRYFTKHTECGCLPLFPGELGTSYIYSNPILSNQTEYEFQLISEPALISLSSVSSNSVIYSEQSMDGRAWEDISYPLSSYYYHHALDNNMISANVTSANVQFKYDETTAVNVADLDIIMPNLSPVSATNIVSTDILLGPALSNYNYSTVYIHENVPITIFYTVFNDDINKVYILPGLPTITSILSTKCVILDTINQTGILYYGINYKYDIELTNLNKTNITFKLTKI